MSDAILSPTETVAVLALALRDPACVRRVPAAALPAGLPRALFVAIARDHVTVVDHRRRVVVTVAAEVRGARRVAQLGSWLAGAPRALVDEGRRIVDGVLAPRQHSAGRAVRPLGALALWRSEVASGARHRDQWDALRRAANYEAAARESVAAGDIRTAREQMRMAARFLLDAPAAPAQRAA